MNNFLRPQRTDLPPAAYCGPQWGDQARRTALG
jgi:hypothetical protein